MPGWNITKKDLMLLCRDGRTLVILLLLPITFMYIIGKSVSTDEDNTRTPIAVWDNVDMDFDMVEYREISPESFDLEPDTPPEELLPIDEELAEMADIEGISVDELKEELESEIALIQKNARMVTDRIIEKLKRHPGMTVTMLHSAEEVKQFQANNHDKIVVEFGNDFWNKVETLDTKDFIFMDQGPLSEGLKGVDVILHPPRIKNSTREAAVDTFVWSKTYVAILPYVSCQNRQYEGFVGKSSCKSYNEPDGVLPPLPELVAEEETENEDQLNELFVFVVPGFTVMFMFFLVNIMARSFLQEKQQGTLQRLQIAPMAPSSVLLGKTIPFFLISLLQTLLLFLFGKFAFDMNMGSDLLMLCVVVVLTSLSVVGLGLIVAVLVKTDAQVSSYANFVVIIMAGVSGCFIPSDWMSDPILSTLRLGTPHHWALQGMRELISAEVPNMEIVGQSCMVLAAFAVCFFVFGTIFWRSRTGS